MSHLRAQSKTCNPNLWHNHCIVRNKSCMRQLRGQTLYFSAWDCFFSAAARKVWAWYDHTAGLVERTAALRKLNFLVGSGGLDFTKGMDSLNKLVQYIFFRLYITFCKHRQLKGWQPHVQLTVAKIHGTNKSTISILYNNSWDHDSVTKPSASLHMTGFFCSCNEGMGMMQPWFHAEMAERTAALRNLKLLIGWMLEIPKRNSENGFLKQRWPTHLLSAVYHILRTWAAKRLAATRPTHCC